MSVRSALRPLPLLLLLGAASLPALSGCSTSEHHEEVRRFPLTRPLSRDTDTVREYVAQIQSSQHIELRAMERGYLQQMHVDEGQAVHEGQPLFQILPAVYRAEQQRAKAEADFAGIEYRNTKVLQERDVVSANELALAKAKLDKANAELALANVHLDQTSIRAPFDGILNRLEVRPGSLVEEGELLSTLSDNRQMWVYFNVTEAEYLDYRQRVAASEPAEVRLRMANGKMFPHPGRVETIEADFNNETGNIAFRATFPNPDGLLRHGETGKVLMSTAIPSALLIPQKATFDTLDRKYVFVVDADDVVHQRRIHVAGELPHVYIVSEGLSPDDRIVLDGLRHVRDGQHIHADDRDPEQVLANLDLPAE